MQSDIYVAPQITLTMKRQFKPRVTVYGAVKHQGPVDLPANSADLATAIVMAGGLRNDAGVMVEIRQPNSTVPILIDLMSAMQSADRDQFRLQDGASVSIETRDPLPIQVIGLVKKSGRYKFPPGEQLRVLDAIALAGGTSNALADKILVIRRPPERDPYVIEVSLRKAKLNASEDIALSPGDTVSIEQTAATVLMDVVQTVRFGIGASVRTIF
jgi:polysaccharide export outer membrane protein